MTPTLTEEIVHSLIVNTNDWRFDEYLATKGNLSIWIGNGIFSLRVEEPVILNFSLFEKLKLWKAIKIAKNKLLTFELSK